MKIIVDADLEVDRTPDVPCYVEIELDWLSSEPDAGLSAGYVAEVVRVVTVKGRVVPLASLHAGTLRALEEHACESAESRAE